MDNIGWILVGQTDRLGSVTVNNRRYYPYGVEYTATSNDTEKYATYTRDSVSGLDYAVNRYYSSIWGRFLSPDRSTANMNLANPGSLNRYAYALADPVNRGDPSGLCTEMIAGSTMSSTKGSEFSNEAAALGATQAYPFAGLNIPQSLASVISQNIGENDSTTVTYDSLVWTLNHNPGDLGVLAYSGAAATFTAAFSQLNPDQQARITTVLYISPGAVGPITYIPGATYIVTGTGAKDNAAVALTAFPKSAIVSHSNCDHTDFACLLLAAQEEGLSAIQSGGPCPATRTFSLTSQAHRLSSTPGQGGLSLLIGGEIYKSGVPSDPAPDSPDNVGDVGGDTPDVTSTIQWGPIVP